MSAKRIALAVLVASTVLLAVGAGPGAAGTARALPAQGGASTIPYVGRLSDKTGQPVADGTYDFTFALYDAAEGGSQLWSETQTGVAVRGGSFTTRLGSVSPLPDGAKERGLWLAVGVRGPGEAEFTLLTPRQALAAPSASPTGGGACPHDHWGEYWTGSGVGLHMASSNDTPLWAETSGGWAGVDGRNTTGKGVYGRSISGTGVWGESTKTGAATGYITGVWGQVAASGNLVRGVVGYATNTSGVSYGVLGESDSPEGTGVYGLGGTGVKGKGGYGVYGEGTYGVWGYSTGADGKGVSGVANNGANAYGVWGQSTSGYAGWFSGKVHVSGLLEKAGGGFKIDHPLDPANQYLYHSFVESPDMKNFYDGVVMLDANGEAVVQLPAWFGALNRDFRYQLTCIGGYAPVYIAEEIADNQFKIAGGKPGLKVSWQVTGIRQDPWANQNRLPVEEDKSPEERGKYLHPESYGLPDTMGVEYAKRSQNK